MRLADMLVGLHDPGGRRDPRGDARQAGVIYQSVPPLPRRLPPLRGGSRCWSSAICAKRKIRCAPLRLRACCRPQSRDPRRASRHGARRAWSAAAQAEMAENPRYQWRAKCRMGGASRHGARAADGAELHHGGRRQRCFRGAGGRRSACSLQDRWLGRTARPRLSGIFGWATQRHWPRLLHRAEPTLHFWPNCAAIAPYAHRCSSPPVSSRLGTTRCRNSRTQYQQVPLIALRPDAADDRSTPIAEPLQFGEQASVPVSRNARQQPARSSADQDQRQSFVLGDCRSDRDGAPQPQFCGCSELNAKTHGIQRAIQGMVSRRATARHRRRRAWPSRPGGPAGRTRSRRCRRVAP